MIPYGRQYIDKNDIDAVTSTLESDFLTQGPEVGAFEKALAEAAGAKYAVAVNSGTAALHLSYLAAGIGEGDEVITTPNTFVATTNMLLAVGAKPVFCDINLDTHNIDEAQVEALITPKTKAIVPVDFAGRPCAYSVLTDIAKKHNLLLIEDGCHALGAMYEGKPVGSIADMTAFSFHPVKPITTGEGGAVLTDNKDFYERALSLRSHGIHKDADGKNVMTELGYNYRMPDILATLGSSQLKKLQGFIEKRREVAHWYHEALDGVGGIARPLPTDEGGWHIYVIRTMEIKNRQPLFEHLKGNGVGVNFHYPAVYSHPYYREHGYAEVSLPNMDQYHNSCITLPCHVHLEQKDVTNISGLIKSYFNE